MQVYILKKEKGKKYESKSICSKVLGFELEYEKDKPLGCSISDTGHFWACAVGCCGLDIEEKTRRLRASTAKALTAPEQEYLSVLSAGS